MSATSPQAGEVVEPLLEYACMCSLDVLLSHTLVDKTE